MFFQNPSSNAQACHCRRPPESNRGGGRACARRGARGRPPTSARPAVLTGALSLGVRDRLGDAPVLYNVLYTMTNPLSHHYQHTRVSVSSQPRGRPARGAACAPTAARAALVAVAPARAARDPQPHWHMRRAASIPRAPRWLPSRGLRARAAGHCRGLPPAPRAHRAGIDQQRDRGRERRQPVIPRSFTALHTR